MFNYTDLCGVYKLGICQWESKCIVIKVAAGFKIQDQV